MHNTKKNYRVRQGGAVMQERLAARDIERRFPERYQEAGTARWTAWIAPLPQGVVALILEQTGKSEAIAYMFADTAEGQEWLCRALYALRRKADQETLRGLRRMLDAPDPWDPIFPVLPEPPRPRPTPEPRYKVLPVPPVFWVPDTQKRGDD